MDNTLRWFRFVAIAEACSWGGLLVGVFFKRVVESGDIGVKIFGPIHGLLFVGYLVALGFARSRHPWSLRLTIFGVLAAIPPFTSLWFERVVTRRAATAASPADVQKPKAETLVS